MVYRYERSPSGDKLAITGCGSGHVQLIVTSGIGGMTVPVCIAPEDLDEVVAEMFGYAPLTDLPPAVAGTARSPGRFPRGPVTPLGGAR